MAMTEDWQWCVDWLVRCRILPNDHKSTKANSSVFDLAQALRDGVLICHLLNVLQPESVNLKEFNQRPLMSQFLCQKNIRTFLQTCRHVFGLRSVDLFDSFDLFEVRDFKKVLHTLSKLSLSDVAKRSGISGFPPDEALMHDHDYYNTLEELANVNDVLDDEDLYGEVDNDDEDKIYDVLINDSEYTEKPKTLTKREMCINELVDTEKNYVVALKMIVENFIQPLSSVLSQQDMHLVFSHIEPLWDIHVTFCTELRKACRIGAISTISEIFVRSKQKFLVYGVFCSNLPKAQDHITELTKNNEAVRNKIEECQRTTNDGKFRLRDLLSVPMQRVLKYHLLLKELIKQTDKFSQDKQYLDQALEAMQDLSLYVNEVKRDNETMEVIKQIQSSIIDLQMPANTTLSDYGRIQKDGELRVRSHADNKDKARYLFLFDKVILMCKSRGETYNFKDALVLGEYRLEEIAPMKDHSRRNDRWSSSFMIVKKDKLRAFTFFSKSEDMKTKWVEAIQLCLDNTHPDVCKKGLDFAMKTFEKPTDCDVCHKLLRGVFFQGYYCNENNMSVHKECIARACEPVLPPRPSPSLPPSRPVICRVRASRMYRGNPSPRPLGPLKFNPDDVIDVLSRDKPDWWEGRLHGDVGFFPPQFVDFEHVKPVRRDSYLHTIPNKNAVPVVVGDRRGSEDSLNFGADSRSQNTGQRHGSPENLNCYDWYVGVMDRVTAERKLENHEDGTFMIRESENPSRKGKYCLSLYYSKQTKHIKVEKTPENMYYIANCKIFHSISELIDYYKINSLMENFPEVETTLVVPYKASAHKYAIAGHDYSANTTGQLSLRKGDRIKILSKAGEDKGWWKGELNNKVGYFPLAYVVDED